MTFTLAFLTGPIQKILASLLVVIVYFGGATGSAFAQKPPITLSQPLGWVECANDGQWCKFPPHAVRDVAYGANGKYAYMWAVHDAQLCANAQFWGDDPNPGVAKKCYYSAAPSRLTWGTMCAIQGKDCVVTGTVTVWFGQGGRFYKKNITAADGRQTTVRCDIATFGQPFDNADKYCLYTN